MRNRLSQRLKTSHLLRDEDLQALDALQPQVRLYPARQTILPSGATPATVLWIEHGWACRSRRLASGAMAVFNFVLPGEFIDPAVVVGLETDHAVVALSDVRALEAPVHALKALMERHPRVGEAIIYGAVEDGARLRDQIAHLGGSSALQRIAFLFHSLARRQAAASGAASAYLDAAFGHDVIAAATGLSRVHVSRTLKLMRDRGLVELQQRRWRILDAEALALLSAGASA
ncbi:MAG: Crp/Fnr family transcriptional regulator [Oceanicaulis sp.]